MKCKCVGMIFLISFGYLYAQKPVFVRVYDLAGKKVNKGDVISVTDTSLQLEGKPVPVNIAVRSIGSIKTKHSAGNNVLLGSIIGTSAMAATGALSADGSEEILGYSAGEGAAAGALIGLPLGAAIGGLTILSKKSKSYLINGDVTKWKLFQVSITEMMVSKKK